MKTLKIIFTILFVASFTVLTAQTGVKANLKTTTFTVNGVCDMCKTTIEKAAKIPGVTAAVWNKQSHKLNLTFNPAKVQVDAVQKAIASVGYDAGSIKATDKAYNSLPSCCKYR
jgi:hypothetical protein